MSNIGNFFEMFFNFWGDIINVLDTTILHISTFNVSIADIIFVFFVGSITVSIFWRGGKA